MTQHSNATGDTSEELAAGAQPELGPFTAGAPLDETATASARLFFESASDAIFVVNGDTFVDCNAQTLRLFRCERGEIIGQAPYAFSPTTQPDGADSRVAAHERLTAAIAGRPQFFEWRHRRQDGVPFDAEVSLNRIEHRGEPRVLAIVRDITSRKQAETALRESEDRLRRIFEQSPMAMAIVGMDGTIEQINQKATETFGYLPEDIPTMDRWWVLAYPNEAYRNEVQAIWGGLVEDAFAHNREIASRDYFVTCKDGAVKTISILGVPVAGKVFVMFGDVTERTLAEERLRNLNAELERRVRERTAELERSNEELSSFAYSISHELRAPIARMDGFSKAIADSVATGDVTSLAFFAQRIESSSQQMRRVIDSLLLLTRLSRVDLALERVDLSEMAQAIVGRLLEGSEAPAVKVTITPGIVAQGDRSLWEVCLQNLLTNAVKYSSKSLAPAIEVGVDSRSGGGAYFVRDNGVGFDMAYAGKLFQPFCRLHNESEFTGTGVGLAIAQRVIERHGGRIWAVGAPGEGATFYFTVGI